MNETADYVLNHVVPDTYGLLPAKMASKEATAMLIAIGLQESQFLHRRQVKGPARGFWQFEEGGAVTGVLTHPLTRSYATMVCNVLRYSPIIKDCYAALEHNDILACSFARLLLWTLPDRLPNESQRMQAWNQYFDTWRPGRPKPDTWHDNYIMAWQFVSG